MLSDIHQPTPEQLQHWAELNELEKYACTGKLSSSELEEAVNRFLDKNNYDHRLEKVRGSKQKLMEELAILEQREQWLLTKINNNDKK